MKLATAIARGEMLRRQEFNTGPKLRYVDIDALNLLDSSTQSRRDEVRRSLT